MHIGNNIAKLRKYRGMKQSEIYTQLKMSQQHYSHIEQSEKIDAELLESIAKIVDFPSDFIRDLDTSAMQTIHNSGSFTDSMFFQYHAKDKIVEGLEEKNRLLEKIVALNDKVAHLERQLKEK